MSESSLRMSGQPYHEYVKAVLAARIPTASKLVAIYLIDRASTEGVAWPSLGTISRECNMTRSTVVRNIAILTKLGWIAREPTEINESARRAMRLGADLMGAQCASTRRTARLQGARNAPRVGAQCAPNVLLTDLKNDSLNASGAGQTKIFDGTGEQDRARIARELNGGFGADPTVETVTAAMGADSINAAPPPPLRPGELILRVAVEAYCDAVGIPATPSRRYNTHQKAEALAQPESCGQEAVLAGLEWGRETASKWRRVESRIINSEVKAGWVEAKPKGRGNGQDVDKRGYTKAMRDFEAGGQ